MTDPEIHRASKTQVRMAKMFGKKVVQELDGIRVTSYLFNGKIVVDDVERISPKKTNEGI